MMILMMMKLWLSMWRSVGDSFVCTSASKCYLKTIRHIIKTQGSESLGQGK